MSKSNSGDDRDRATSLSALPTPQQDGVSGSIPEAARQRNRAAWDRMAQQQHPFARPAKAAALRDPLGTVDSLGWLGSSIHGKELLCLAAGGGKHSVIYAQAGARVTVVDLSPAMLALDRKASQELGLPVAAVEASMDDLSIFSDARFDIVIQPVSTCYLPETGSVYAEVARVIKPNGVYVSQHKQPASLQASLGVNQQGRYELLESCDRRHALPASEQRTSLREPGTSEFVHTWESLLGHLCRAGFLIEDLIEPWHGDPEAASGTFAHRARYLPPYVRIKARRRGSSEKGQSTRLWTPGE